MPDSQQIRTSDAEKIEQLSRMLRELIGWADPIVPRSTDKSMLKHWADRARALLETLDDEGEVH